MSAGTILHSDLVEQRRRLADTRNESQHEFQRLAALSAVLSDCGANVSYQYPTLEDLGLTADEVASNDPSVQSRVANTLNEAGDRSLDENGHIEYLLGAYGLMSEEQIRARKEALARSYVEMTLKIQQIDALILVLLSADPASSPSNLAKAFCEIKS
jgi:hypothetical protein